jgi:hypothetical protein
MSSKTVPVSKENLAELARALAVSDALLTLIVKAAEQFRATDRAINPDSLITYITNNRPKFLEDIIEVHHEQT